MYLSTRNLHSEICLACEGVISLKNKGGGGGGHFHNKKKKNCTFEKIDLEKNMVFSPPPPHERTPPWWNREG